jgi:uncharacterized membrane protein YcaP (DUF421 family)
MGQPDFDELKKCRMSSDELLIALRKSGTTDISEIAYAILEQDGNVSVIPRAYAKPATAKDVAAGNTESGMFRIIVDKGEINDASLQDIGWSHEKAFNIISNNNYDILAVDLMIADDAGNYRIFTARNNNEK